MIQVNFKKSNFLITDFKAKGALSNRALVVTNAGTYFYDVYSRSVENYSFVADTAPITQVQNFKISFHSLKTVSPSNSSLGFLLTFPSGGFIVFDRDFSDETKLKVFVSPEQEYSPNPLSSPFDSYTCLNPYPHLNQILQTTHSMSISILNKDTQNKLVTLKINEVIIFEGYIDFKTLCLKDFNIGIHNFNNDLRVTSMSVEGDDSKDIIVNKTSYQYWRVSNIKNRRADQFYRSVGNLIFKANSGEVSDNPAYGFSESHFDSDSLPGNAFDGLDSTYTLSSSLEDGTNNKEHGSSWWIGYKFSKPVELDSLAVSMRYDMEKEVYKYGEDFLGQEWTSFAVDGSDDGLSWATVFSCFSPKIFKNDTSFHVYKRAPVDEIFSRFWKVSNIVPLDGDNIVSASILELNSKPPSEILKISSDTYGSSYDSKSIWRLLDKNPLTTWRNNNFENESITFEFKDKVSVQSINLQMRQDMSSSWFEEWQSADISFSIDGISWIEYGSINPQIKNMDLKLKSDIPIDLKFNFKSILVYSNNVETNLYKFWRCSNINTLPSYDNLSFDVSGSILKFINTENLNLSNKENSFSTSSANKEVGKGVPSNGFDNDPLTWFHSQHPESQNIILKNYENYSIGCMFEDPVEVVKIGYKPRPNLDIKWGQTWQSCNVQYSPNGFDWFTKGYCEFNIPRVDSSYYEKEIQTLENLDTFKFWRVSKVFNKGSSQYPQFLGYTGSFSGWELRFNTITGEISNDPSRGFSSGSYSTAWSPSRAFDGNVATNAGGFHTETDNPDLPFIGYEFEKPQHVNSISLLSRRDSDLPHQNWLFAHIEASNDNINWEFRGFAHLDVTSSSRFFTAKLESISPFDKLTTYSLEPFNSVSFKELEFKPFGSTLIDTNNISINIYTKDNDGTISGEVTELDIPVIREVGLYDRATRQLIAVTWSDEKGQYKFTGIDSTRKYYVHAIDSNDFYNAVTQDMIEPLI